MALVVVQRGHVGRKTGATGAPGEQQFAIEAAERARHHVTRIGHRVRIVDADPPSSAYTGDAFVAIHYDSSTASSARGASVGYQTPEGKAFASAWKRHYAANGWSGGFRPDNYTAALAGYYGVRKAVAQGNRRAIIVEAGFHSNPEDRALLASPAGPDRVGVAIAAALVDLLGATCPPGPQPPGLPAYPGLVRMGDRGQAVRTWQRELNARGGYAAGPHRLVVDGIFGFATHHVVCDFQRKRGLVVDGIAGPATWHALIVGTGR